MSDLLDHLLGLAFLADLLAGNFQLALQNLGRNAVLVQRDGVHGSGLHRYVTTGLGRRRRQNHRRSQLVVGVDVSSNERTFYLLVESDFNLLANDTGLLRQFVGNRAVFKRKSQQIVLGGGEAGQCGIGQLVGQGQVAVVFGNEVGLAVQGDHHTAGCVGVGLCNYRAFGGVAVGALGSDLLTFFTEVVNGLLKITVGLNQGVFAVHHACTRDLAQLVYVGSSNSHVFVFFT